MNGHAQLNAAYAHMTSLKTYVVDQGWMRSAELSTLIANEPHSRFVIPDIAMVEMSKSGNWEGTMRPSLKNFYPAVSRTFMSLSVGEALQIELKQRRSIESDLLPKEFTQFIRGLISELTENREGPTVKRMRAEFNAVFADLLKNDLLESDAKPRLAGLVQPWISGLKPETLSILRREPEDRRFRLCLGQANGAIFSQKIAKESGMSDEEADAFLISRPLLLRYVYAFTRHALRWVIKSGWSNVEAGKAMNHFLDQDYVLIGSFFDDLLTKDGEARQAYEDLKIMLATPLTEAAEYCNSILKPSGN